MSCYNSDAESIDLSDIQVLSDLSYDYVSKKKIKQSRFNELEDCLNGFTQICENSHFFKLNTKLITLPQLYQINEKPPLNMHERKRLTFGSKETLFE